MRNVRIEREERVGDYTTRISVEANISDVAVQVLREAWDASYAGIPKENPVVLPAEGAA